ncbi:MAG: CoA-binding protein, partial [Halothiobacillus sp.]
MTGHILEPMFNPRGIAVFGASERPGAVGTMVLENLRAAGFAGAIVPVNPKHVMVQGFACVPDVSHLNQPVDLA